MALESRLSKSSSLRMDGGSMGSTNERLARDRRRSLSRLVKSSAGPADAPIMSRLSARHERNGDHLSSNQSVAKARPLSARDRRPVRRPPDDYRFVAEPATHGAAGDTDGNNDDQITDQIALGPAINRSQAPSAEARALGKPRPGAAELSPRAGLPDEFVATGLPEEFQLLSVIARGVCKALVREPNYVVALKEVTVSTPTERVRLLRETETMTRCRHRHIVRYYGCKPTSSTVFLVLEFCDMGSMQSALDVLGPRRPLKEATIVRCVADVTAALAHVHKLGCVHRDVKLDNILLSAAHHGACKLADFGLAAFLDSNGRRRTRVGSPHYIDPSLLSTTTSYTQACDLWSLGIVVIALFAGQPPHWGLPAGEVLNLVRNTTQPPEISRDSASLYALDFTERLLLLLPSQRTSAEELLDHPWLVEKKKEKEKKETKEEKEHRIRKPLRDLCRELMAIVTRALEEKDKHDREKIENQKKEKTTNQKEAKLEKTKSSRAGQKEERKKERKNKDERKKSKEKDSEGEKKKDKRNLEAKPKREKEKRKESTKTRKKDEKTKKTEQTKQPKEEEEKEEEEDPVNQKEENQQKEHRGRARLMTSEMETKYEFDDEPAYARGAGAPRPTLARTQAANALAANKVTPKKEEEENDNQSNDDDGYELDEEPAYARGAGAPRPLLSRTSAQHSGLRSSAEGAAAVPSAPRSSYSTPPTSPGRPGPPLSPSVSFASAALPPSSSSSSSSSPSSLKNWKRTSSGGQCYWFHTETGESRWAPPEEEQEEGAAPLPSNWSSASDLKGRRYYFNELTNEVSWSRPRET